MLAVFKENMNLKLLPTFYGSIMFVLEQQSFQNKLQSTGLEPLLEISEKFIAFRNAIQA